MLDPRSRGALLEALRPPPGYVVDAAVATTYSLDLVALLTAPLAFSLFDRIAAREGQGPERLDSFALLHAVRAHAEKLVVFCESGCVAAPRGYRQLIAYLEDAVVQVRTPNPDGVFHPKIWVTRLVSAIEGEAVRYRVLVLSRNLTFDRSWDTVLTLDGEVQDRTRAIGESRPLGDFVAALPDMALQAMRADQKAMVNLVASELRRTRFDVPAPFEAMQFWPMGLDGKPTNPFEGRIERLLVVSPFVTASRLEKLVSTSKGKAHVLVARVEELQLVPPAVLKRYSEVCVLDDAFDDVEGDEEASAVGVGGPIPPSQGLHAKVYVADDGWNAHVWTGSANASDAAFTANVEILVQLTGKKKDVGVDAFLAAEGGLRPLLVAYRPPAEPLVPSEIDEQLEETMRLANRAIARGAWEVNVEADGSSFSMTLRLAEGALVLPPGATVSVWPIALPVDRCLPLDPSSPQVRFDGCTLQALTAFFAFEVAVRVGGRAERARFVVRAAMRGAPSDRHARILHGLLDDPSKVLRFLQMLLSLDAFDALELLDPGDETKALSSSSRAASDVIPLFESLVRTLDREPERLAEVERLVAELGATPEGAKLLPPEFEQIWRPIHETWTSLPARREP